MRYVYGIYDKKLGEYGAQLECEKNNMMVCRHLQDVLKRIDGAPLVAHAEDFDVMCLGEIDEETGVFVGYPTIRFVENLANLVPAPPVKGIGVVKKEA